MLRWIREIGWAGAWAGLLLFGLVLGSIALVAWNRASGRAVERHERALELAAGTRRLAWELVYRAERLANAGEGERARRRDDLDRAILAMTDRLEALRQVPGAGLPGSDAAARSEVQIERAIAMWHESFRPALAAEPPRTDQLEPLTVRFVAVLDELIRRRAEEGASELSVFGSRQVRFATGVSAAVVALTAIGILVLARARAGLVAAAARQRAVEERFSLFMRHLPCLAWLKDRDGRLVFANEHFARSFPVVSEGWIGKRDEEIWPPAVAARVRDDDRRVLEDGQSLSAIETLPVRGEDRNWLAVRFPIPDAEGRPALLGGFGIDITDRLRADEAREESRSRYEAIVEGAVDGILTIDERGVIESVNSAALRMFGYEREELVGRNVGLLMPQPYRDEHDGYIARYLRTGEARIIGVGREVTAESKDGSVFPVELAVTELTVRGRRLFTGIVRDISLRRRAELLAEFGVIAAGMAHEIGTPMNVILGRAEHLRERVQDPALVRSLDAIIGQVERITRLMNQLLQLTRPHTLERRPTDLNHVVHETLYVVEERLRRRGIKVEIDSSPELPRAELDPDRMSQLVLNLVLNAIDAMQEGGTLTLRTARAGGDEREDPAVELEVGDTGCGIPPEQLSRIFAPFYTTKGAGKGTGLGLPVVQGIVNEHGGRITVESEPGRGTVFRVRLPLRAGGARRA